MQGESVMIAALRRELRAAMGDRTKLSALHSQLTDRINSAYGTEKEQLLRFRQEVKDALSCRLPGSW